ncbi:MFS transporter [Streptomyces sp. LP05-1]|uniref:MFS transporter n=1 Tax=Streptomyces pyxinae TaxID=2970734 RepID=A0ABT2CQC5_9ACTN|nr:MFS transporter [Streptomyces sp. LP05-1]MCS0639638.1 MFS transporter [Streptomyces sp. LP05-1]
MSYAALLGRPAVPVALGGALLGRLPTAMTALAMTLTLRAHGAGFRFIGVATAVLAVAGAAGGPALSRLADRRGQTRVLVAGALVSAGGILLVALAPASRPAVLAGAALAGAAAPPLEPCLRALWPVLVGQENLQRAYALDAAAQELVFIGGPLLVSATVALAPPEAAVALSAALCLAGTLVMAGSRPSREWRGSPGGGDWLGPLRSRALILLFLGLAGAGSAIGGLNIVAVAYAERHPLPGGAGTLLALSACGALIGAVLYGRSRWSLAPTARAVLFGAGLTVTYLLVALMAPVPVMVPVCLSTGFFLSPLLVVSFSLVDALAPAGTVTEAFAWLITLLTTGTALGSALAGYVSDLTGPGPAAAATALCALLGTGFLLLCHRLPESARQRSEAPVAG